MANNTEIVRTYFAKLGLETEIADIYLALYTHGPQTISELSRNSSVERTRVYRLLDSLLDTGLIEVESHYKRGIIKSAPISNLAILVSKKEQEVKSLQDELSLIEQVLSQNVLSSPATRIQFYKGPEGIRQMFWNQTRTNGEIVAFLHKNIRHATNSKFFERWIEKTNEREIHFRVVFDDSFLQEQKSANKTPAPEKLTYWQGRYFKPGQLILNHNMNIYDNVTATYSWHNGEVFGIETYNQDIADLQRQLFEIIWQQSKPMDVQASPSSSNQ